MMEEKKESGYLELEHTADWALRIWAPDLEGLFSTAAQGMYALMETELQSEPRYTVPIQLEGYDPESLLVSFLGELLYLGEEQGMGFDHFQLAVQATSLEGVLSGARIASQRKEIKAVTYHDLAVVRSAAGLEATVVFDV